VLASYVPVALSFIQPGTESLLGKTSSDAKGAWDRHPANKLARIKVRSGER
jgi:hypothetical protein